MSFALTSRKIAVSRSDPKGLILSAECRTLDRKWIESSIQLNNYLGNNDGSFRLQSHDFYDYTQEGSEILEGSVLSIKLRNNDGKFVPASIDLNLCIANINGTLVFGPP
jgi:hypothetical protein